MLTLACVLSNPGEKYNDLHVARLRKQIKLNQPYRFVCVKDSPFDGWWAKMSLFEPQRFSGRVLYLDLDVEVLKPLDEIADFPAPFGMIKDWNVPGYNSSVMVWDAGYLDYLYEKFTKDPEKFMSIYHGDQNFITDYAKPAKFPTKWCSSYKKHVKSDTLPAETKIICYHGKTKPWHLNENK